MVGRAFRAYLAATVLTVAATQVASLVDAALVGSLISAEALGAVNISKPILQLTFSVGNLFIIGASVLAGMAIGSGDRGQANRIFTRCFRSVGISGLLILLLGLTCFDGILGMLCSSDTLRPMAGGYMRIMFVTMVPFLLSYMLETFVIVDDSPKLATLAVVISNVANIILDVLFIAVLGWGVEGAASATLIMYVISTLILLLHFRKGRKDVKVLALDMGSEPGIMKKVVMMGLPVTITTFLIAVQIAGCNLISTKFLGDAGVITFAVCIALLGFSMIFVAGTMRTIQPVGAILKGMGDARGILLMMGRAFRFITVCLVIYTLIILIFPEAISSLFGVKDEAMLPIAAKALPVFTLNIILEGIYSLFIPAYQFYDHNKLAMFVALSKAIFPMFGFWGMAALSPGNSWWGFFIGQAAVGLVLLYFTTRERNRNKQLSPVLLVPLEPETEVLDLSVPARVDAINDVTNPLVDFVKSKGGSEHTANYAALCCEELLKNIADHGKAHFVDVKAMMHDGVANISIHDDGVAFNPIDTKEKDQLGLAIVRGIGSNMRYEYIFNQNMVNVEVK